LFKPLWITLHEERKKKKITQAAIRSQLFDLPLCGKENHYFKIFSKMTGHTDYSDKSIHGLKKHEAKAAFGAGPMSRYVFDTYSAH